MLWKLHSSLKLTCVFESLVLHFLNTNRLVNGVCACTCVCACVCIYYHHVVWFVKSSVLNWGVFFFFKSCTCFWFEKERCIFRGGSMSLIEFKYLLHLTWNSWYFMMNSLLNYPVMYGSMYVIYCSILFLLIFNAFSFQHNLHKTPGTYFLWWAM